MLSIIRKSQNGYLQGTVFLANIVVRPFLYSCSRRKNKFAEDVYAKLASFKTSDTLFILGSGESINELDDNQLAVIKQCDSIGFNFWLLHELVPTYYVCEFLPESRRSDLLWRNLELRADEYLKTPVIFKFSKAFLHELHRIPDLLRELYVVPQMSIPGMSAGTLGLWLKVLDKTGVLRGAIIGDMTLYRQASLSWLLVFAFRLRYEKIVFCGVDLNSPYYFYDRETALFPNKNILVPPSEFTSSVHPTNDASLCAGELPISTVINIFNNEIFKNHCINLYSGSKTSALFPSLPMYDW